MVPDFLDLPPFKHHHEGLAQKLTPKMLGSIQKNKKSHWRWSCWNRIITAGRLPFVCVEGNMTCVECFCIPTEKVAIGTAGESAALAADLPIAALAAGVTVSWWRRNNKQRKFNYG